MLVPESGSVIEVKSGTHMRLFRRPSSVMTHSTRNKWKVCDFAVVRRLGVIAARLTWRQCRFEAPAAGRCQEAA